MLPPVLEIYVIWHPGDNRGKVIAEEFITHFQGSSFFGLISGAIEIYIRSEGWRHSNDSPRPIPLPDPASQNRIPAAQITAIVPILGINFAEAVQSQTGEWYEYVTSIVHHHQKWPNQIGIFPLAIHSNATRGTVLGELFNQFQLIASVAKGAPPEPESELRCRDLAQAITQMMTDHGNERLTIFISHTKHATHAEKDQVTELINKTRAIIGNTRLQQFFDANDLQPGRNWDDELRSKAASSALLALRTDLYSSRDWCQREMLIAKQAGMPIVILNALNYQEVRGSFLMDHVPRVPIRQENAHWKDSDIQRGLNLLVDECLKRILWKYQAELAQETFDIDIDWWASQAPEPSTFVKQLALLLRNNHLASKDGLRIIHPDPPLGAEEKAIITQIFNFSNVKGRLDITTPRLLATRGI